MRSKIVVSWLKLVLLIMFADVSAIAYGQDAYRQEISAKRWDIRMLEEAPIWRSLVLNYRCAEKPKYWPEKKAALQAILSQFSTSRWADDAALVLAGDQASIDKNTEGAIDALRQVMENYPSGNTVVTGWYSDFGCTVDEIWLRVSGRLRTKGRPFGRDDGSISEYNLAFLSYFNHTEKYPRRTIDVAQLIIAEMLMMQDNTQGAVGELESIVARSANLSTIAAADRQLANRPDAHIVENLAHTGLRQQMQWPQYSAYVHLMRLYQSQGEVEKAIAVGLELANIASPDGGHWSINRSVGNLLAKNGRWAKAEEQYQLALNGYREYVEDQIAQKESSNDSPPPGVSWRQQILEEWGMGRKLTKLENLVSEARAKR